MAGWTWFNGEWRDESAPMISVNSQGVWLSSFIFDGARAFDGMTPDLDLHCARALTSAERFGLLPKQTAEDVYGLAVEGVAKFAPGTDLYIRPMYWAEKGWVAPDPESTTFAITVTENPMPAPTGFSAMFAPFRRPAPDMAPTDTKAACLYPNAGRALQYVRDRGYDNAIVFDPDGNIAEFATANLFFSKDGVVKTPAPTGSFLNGITRQRMIQLMRDNGVDVEEVTVTKEDLLTADEIFNTGNHGKVMPVSRFEDRDMQPGPFFQQARELYWDYAAGTL